MDDLAITVTKGDAKEMPTDSVKNRTFREALNGTVRFEIPFFQRGYAWEKKQWDQLFLDIQEQIIDELIAGQDIDDVEHFFGPIVVLEKAGGTDELKEFLVIDGQQRMTTVYLLLAAIKAELAIKKHLSADAAPHISEISKYLINDVSSADDYIKLKVFSSKGDRLPTYRAVFGSDKNPKTPMLHVDQELYVPGRNRVDEFCKYATKKLKSQCKDVPALWQFAKLLLDCLKFVWIPLDYKKDDPQAIFESLNDKGMPLKASELLCNFLFRPIMDAKGNHEELHNSRWLAAMHVLDNNYDRFEEYLRCLFSIGESKMVGRNRKVYVHFKAKNRHLTSSVAMQHLEDIFSGASLYRTIQEPLLHPHSDTNSNELLIAISNTRMDSSTPFVLSLLRAFQGGQIDEDVLRKILKETLVLLVRRKMTELPTTQYDTMFPQLLSKIIYEPKPILALQEQFRKANVWVSDQEFEHALVNKPTYRIRDPLFSRMILVEIDKRFQSWGQFPDYTTVNTIEHMLPQKLDNAWKAYLGEDAEDEHLQARTDTVGNLCLLSGPANSSAGQNPFSSKQAAYSQVTALARQLKEHPGPWNLKAIEERSKNLAAEAIQIWPWAIV